MNIWRFSTTGAVLRCETPGVQRPAIRDTQVDDSHVVLGLRTTRWSGSASRRRRTISLPMHENRGFLSSHHRRAGLDRGVRAAAGRFATNEPRRICQIPRTMKIVYTQGCSCGPERDNQLSYMTNDPAMAPWYEARLRTVAGIHQNVARLSRCSTSTTRLEASLGETRCETRQPADAQPLKVASHDS